MADTPEQNQDSYPQEMQMADGPVSAGASNKDAPMNTAQDTMSIEAKKRLQQQSGQDYNRMITSDASGPEKGSGTANNKNVDSVAGGTLPDNGTGASGPRGGINTSDSTVSAGGSSAGAVVGGGSPTERGSVTSTGMNASTNTKDNMDEKSDVVSNTQGDV